MASVNRSPLHWYPFRDVMFETNDDFPCCVALLSPRGNVVKAQLRAGDVDPFLGLIVALCVNDDAEITGKEHMWPL